MQAMRYAADAHGRRLGLENKFKHLTMEDRYSIKEGLESGQSFKEIARRIGKDCTTVSKEVRFRKIFVRKGAHGQRFNDCAKRFDCHENSLCAGKVCRNGLCRNCRADVPFCGKRCELYVRERCAKLDKPPYTCNRCKLRYKCTLEKALYDPRSAQAEYEALLHDARAGFDLDDVETERLDGIVSPLLKKGQSLHHICVTNADRIMLSERAMYNYVDGCVFSARNIDMPRKVRYKKRKKKRDAKVDKACLVGRDYADYQAYMAANPDVGVVEMDTVHGAHGGKALLTLHFVAHSFMLAFLIDGLTAHDVSVAFAGLRRSLGADLFAKLFPVLLTDRGSEFSNPKSIEFGEDGEGLSRLFYCDPNRPDQKGAAENAHALVRRVIPKGTPLDGYCQDDISLTMNHVNSHVRKSLNDRSPMEVFGFVYGKDVLQKLGAELVPPDKVMLRPELLKHK